MDTVTVMIGLLQQAGSTCPYTGDWCYNHISHMTGSWNGLYEREQMHIPQWQMLLVSRMLLNSGCS